MKHHLEKPYLRETLLLSARPAPAFLGADFPIPAKLRPEFAPDLQAYVMIFFRAFLMRFCRGQDMSGFAQDDIAPGPAPQECPQITLARYLCHLHLEIYRRGRAGVPIPWKKQMSYAARKTALLQRSFMWRLYFARRRIAGTLYSVIKTAAISHAALATSRSRVETRLALSHADRPLIPP